MLPNVVDFETTCRFAVLASSRWWRVVASLWGRRALSPRVGGEIPCGRGGAAYLGGGRVKLPSHRQWRLFGITKVGRLPPSPSNSWTGASRRFWVCRWLQTLVQGRSSKSSWFLVKSWNVWPLGHETSRNQNPPARAPHDHPAPKIKGAPRPNVAARSATRLTHGDHPLSLVNVRPVFGKCSQIVSGRTLTRSAAAACVSHRFRKHFPRLLGSHFAVGSPSAPLAPGRPCCCKPPGLLPAGA